MSQELKTLTLEKIKIANTIKPSNGALASANDQIKKAEQMIKRAIFLLSKAELVRAAETA